MESDDREGLIEDYLETLLPEKWDLMDLYERRSFLAGQSEFGTEFPVGIIRRERVCVHEIWCECLGKDKSNLRRQDSFEIIGVLMRIGGWVGEVVDYMQACMPKEKILLGMPTYGYDWSSGGGAQSITASKLAALKDKYKVSEHFDNESMSPYFTYWDEQGQSHQIWMENQKSLQSKLNTAIEAKVGGISFWRIGNGFYDLYEVLDQSGFAR
jgi:GH18 family chitinase